LYLNTDENTLHDFYSKLTDYRSNFSINLHWLNEIANFDKSFYNLFFPIFKFNLIKFYFLGNYNNLEIAAKVNVEI